MDINIDITGVFDKVKMLSSFVGRNSYDNEANSLFDKILVTNQDKPLLEKYMYDGIENLVNLLGEYCSSSSQSSITIKLPIRFDNTKEDSLKTEILAYLADYTFSQWLLFNNSEKDAHYSSLATNSITRIRNMIYTKTKPL